MRSTRPLLLSVILASAALLAACNESSPSSPGENNGGGDFDVAAGVFYADTLNDRGLPDYQPLQSGSTDTLGYALSHKLLKHEEGAATVTTLGFLQVGVGMKNAVSGTYDVYPHDADYPNGAIAGLAGKVRLYVWGIPGGMAWSNKDSTGSAKVKIVVTGDTVQTIGKNIKLSNGKRISFNIKARKTF